MKYRIKRWNSLIDFRDYLVKSKSEIVVDFNGHTLVTDQGRYGLAFGILTFQEELIVIKKATVKKAVVKKAVVKKAPVKKAVAKKAVVKKAPVKKAVVKKVVIKTK